MIRMPAIILGVFGLSLAVLAVQEPAKDKEPEPVLKRKKGAEPEPNKDDKGDLKTDKKKEPRELKKLGPDDAPKLGAGESPEEIVARIKKNLEDTSRLLEEKDPGDLTRKKQRDIVKDLDDLINQENESNNNSNNSNQGGAGGQGGQGGQGGSQGGQGGGRSGRRGGRQGGTSNQGGGQANSGGTKGGGQGQTGSDASKQQGNGQGGNAGAKNEAADKGNKDGHANARPKEDKKQPQNAGINPPPPNSAKAKTPADVREGLWGHYPDRQRQEMQAHRNETFLPRYRDLLREYHDTISTKESQKK